MSAPSRLALVAGPDFLDASSLAPAVEPIVPVIEAVDLTDSLAAVQAAVLAGHTAARKLVAVSDHLDSASITEAKQCVATSLDIVRQNAVVQANPGHNQAVLRLGAGLAEHHTGGSDARALGHFVVGIAELVIRREPLHEQPKSERPVTIGTLGKAMVHVLRSRFDNLPAEHDPAKLADRRLKRQNHALALTGYGRKPQIR